MKARKLTQKQAAAILEAITDEAQLAVIKGHGASEVPATYISEVMIPGGLPTDLLVKVRAKLSKGRMRLEKKGVIRKGASRHWVVCTAKKAKRGGK